MTKRKHSNRKPAGNSRNSRQSQSQNQSHKGFDESILFGFHTVKEALNNPKRKLVELKATKNALRELENDLIGKNLQITPVLPEELNKMFKPDTVHQGVALVAQPLPEIELEDLIASGKTLIVLDQVTDPRNIGAIMRAATVFGAGGIIMTRHNAPTASGALAKTASGALEHMPLVSVGNLARCLNQLADAGYATFGLDETGTTFMSDIDRSRPIALVMGAEGKGLRRLTRENCSELVRLPNAVTQNGADFACLNVATATAVSLYELFRGA